MARQQSQHVPPANTKERRTGAPSQRGLDLLPRQEDKPGHERGPLHLPAPKDSDAEPCHKLTSTTAPPASHPPTTRLRKRLPPSATTSLDTRPNGPENSTNAAQKPIPKPRRLPVSLSRGALDALA